MTAYVDDAIHPFGRMLMCHLWADTEEELLAMVDKIGVQRKWIQGHPTLSLPQYRKASWVHFDIAKGKRALAIKAGAVASDRYEALAHCARLKIKTGIPALVEQGEAKLRMVAECRERNLAPAASSG